MSLSSCMIKEENQNIVTDLAKSLSDYIYKFMNEDKKYKINLDALKKVKNTVNSLL